MLQPIILNMFKSSYQEFGIAVTLEGAVVDLTGMKLIFTVKQDPATQSDAQALIQKTTTNGGIVVTDAANGVAVIKVLVADTISAVVGPYFWDLRLIASGKMFEIAQGSFNIIQNVTRVTS